MKRILNIAAACVLAWNAGGVTGAASVEPAFRDVPPSFWAADAIAWGIGHHLISGYPDQTFKPDQPVKESEFLAMLLRFYADHAAIALKPGGANWAKPYYQAAASYHWPASPTDANVPITRGKAAKLIAASQGFHYDTNNAVQYLYNLGVAKGRSGTPSLSGFGKEDRLTRAEAVQLIKSLADKGVAALKKRPDQPSPPLLAPQAELYPFMKNRKWGYMDASGRIWVDPQFSDARPFREGMAAVYFNGKWGFVDANGEIAIPLRFDSVNDFHEGLAAVRVGYKYGYIDKTGNWAIPPVFSLEAYASPLQYDENADFRDGLAVIRTGGKSAFINKTGKVATASYDQVKPYSEGLAAVRVGSLWGYIDKAGRWVVRPQFDIANDFHEGLAAVARSGHYGYIDKTGTFVIAPRFSLGDLPSMSGGAQPHDFHEGLALVAVDGKFGYLDKTGKLVIPPTIDFRNKTNDYAADFSDGMALVRVGYRFGYLDKTGKMVISPQFDGADDFSDGLARVRLKGKDGYVDKTGRLAIKPQYREAYPFRQGLALVASDGYSELYYIDKQGNRVTE
ncbi:hypothetical protein G3578_07110 [Brevibacillus sp. SYP-B805]|nr:hypothetical protein [Brevibacillus sp. SYP-B805]